MLYFFIAVVCARFWFEDLGVELEKPSIFDDMMSLITRNTEEYRL